LSAIVTAFLLVLSGGVIARVSQGDVQTAEAAPVATAPARPAIDPVAQMANQFQALLNEREAAYRDLIKQANERLQAAYAQSAALAQAAAAPAQAAAAPAQSAAATNQPAATGQAAPVVAVSAEAAAGIATDAAAGNKLIVRAPELVLFEGQVAYEVVFKHGSIYVDANSGRVLFNGTQNRASHQTASTAPQPGSGHDDDHHENEGHDD
jgi:uncharacterized membrane protein YkoI